MSTSTRPDLEKGRDGTHAVDAVPGVEDRAGRARSLVAAELLARLPHHLSEVRIVRVLRSVVGRLGLPRLDAAQRRLDRDTAASGSGEVLAVASVEGREGEGREEASARDRARRF